MHARGDRSNGKFPATTSLVRSHLRTGDGRMRASQSRTQDDLYRSDDGQASAASATLPPGSPPPNGPSPPTKRKLFKGLLAGVAVAVALIVSALLLWDPNVVYMFYRDSRIRDESTARAPGAGDYVSWGSFDVPDGRVLHAPLGSLTKWPATTPEECKKDLFLERRLFGDEGAYQVATPEGSHVDGIPTEVWCMQYGAPMWLYRRPTAPPAS